MLTLSVLSVLALLAHSTAHAATAELVKAATDAAEKAGLTDIKSVTETAMYRCYKCYSFEVKGRVPASPEMDASVTVGTSGTMSTPEQPGATMASAGEIKLTPKPTPQPVDSSDDSVQP